uniref:Ribosomal protein S25 n=1 Tax=Solanum lycopersicum TaxID=4081 RepID=A0A3Q7IHU2_SOLLC
KALLQIPIRFSIFPITFLPLTPPLSSVHRSPINGSKEGTSSTSIFQASKVRRWKAEEEEVEQGKAKGKGEQHGVV